MSSLANSEGGVDQEMIDAVVEIMRGSRTKANGPTRTPMQSMSAAEQQPTIDATTCLHHSIGLGQPTVIFACSLSVCSFTRIEVDSGR